MMSKPKNRSERQDKQERRDSEREKKKAKKPFRIIDPRGGVNPLIPYVIRPRRTALLDPLPTLEWNAAQDATGYSVYLQVAGETIWETETEETRLVYTGEPSLEPDVDYQLLVEANTGTSSSDDDMPDGVAFQLLSSSKAQQVQAAMQQARQAFTAEKQPLAVLSIYRTYELRAEAIHLLETAIQQGSRGVEIHQALGELYSEVGLILKAEETYREAVRLAEDTDDLVAQAAAAAGLGTVYAGLKKQGEALYWLTQAKYGYEALGEMEVVKALQERLVNLDLA